VRVLNLSGKESLFSLIFPSVVHARTRIYFNTLVEGDLGLVRFLACLAECGRDDCYVYYVDCSIIIEVRFWIVSSRSYGSSDGYGHQRDVNNIHDAVSVHVAGWTDSNTVWDAHIVDKVWSAFSSCCDVRCQRIDARLHPCRDPVYS